MELFWFGRPVLPQLGIDLAAFDQAGVFLYEGVTTGGRPIRAKYRSGALRIGFGDTGEELLSARIGGGLDYGMLPEQVCDLAGMTVLGRAPEISPEAIANARYGAIDWSGKTLHLRQWMSVTEEGERRLQAAVDELARCWPARLTVPRHGPGARIIQAPLTLPAGIEVADTALGVVSAEAPSDDPEARKTIEARLGPLLFKTCDVIDVADGRAIRRNHGSAERGAFSSDLIAWCAASPARYFGVSADPETGRPVGLRPPVSASPARVGRA
jgi:hypothetical protein